MSQPPPSQPPLPKTLAMDAFALGQRPPGNAAFGPPPASSAGWGPPAGAPSPWDAPPPAWGSSPPPAQRSSAGLWIGVGAGGGCLLLLLVGIGGAGLWMLAGGDSTRSEVRAATVLPPRPPLPVDAFAGQRFQLPVPAGTPVRGAAIALVTIVEFADFECPYSQRAALTLTELEALHPGQVRLVFRHNPLPHHPGARDAALASAEAYAQGGDASFWRMHDILFERPSYAAFARTDLSYYALRTGLDRSRFENTMDARLHEASIRRDQELAARIGATGTPTFYINGRELIGAQPLARFEEMVGEELRHAQALVAAGVPPAQVYTTLVANGRTTPLAPAQ